MRHGIDTTDIQRIKDAYNKRPSFATKVLTPNELEIFNNLKNQRKFEYLAGRFSAKESFSKAFGTGIGSAVSFQDVEILNDAHTGAPYLSKYPKKNQYQADITITHTDTVVTTLVVLESTKEDENMVVGYHRNTRAIIDLDAIKANIIAQKKRLKNNQEIFAVVKANAYGHGIVPVAQAAKKAGAKGFCVAIIDEGLALRNAGIKDPILILGVNPVQEVRVMAENDLAVAVDSLEFLQAAKEILVLNHLKLKVHLALDTGMGRIGFFNPKSLKAAAEFLTANQDYFDFEGMFTHFSTADSSDNSYFEKQVKKFDDLLKVVTPKPKYVHQANSATALWHEPFKGNLVRMGISMYGLNPAGTTLTSTMPLKPAFSLESEIVSVKQIEPGTSIGYGKTYTSQETEYIGTVPMGYADGWSRKMQGFKVLVNGQYCEIVGRVCMDQFMIRLPKKYAVGTKVTLIGEDNGKKITVDDVADYAQTINYEIVCGISSRVPRIYSER
ncbi:alanine racemase [Ligilactobacillus hayakitensis DSM 18933 = JCM 14209]|uniref:Multifunctional fusion protein n=2 Tax=Ligilactobacillus TaxID=2767887 RepID=A0A0R1WJ52_9LACO|nr:alanine racemase [Ligilactobacillus hayakitensis DSM 18933 = JCM 14209]